MLKKDSHTHIQNMAVVLEFIYRNPKTSRIEISNASGLTPATITNIMNDLLAKGWVLETGDVKSGVPGSGRRRKVLILNEEIGYFVGVEINMKGIFAVVTDILGKIVSQDALFTNDYHIENINDVVASMISKVTDGIDSEFIFGAGIAIPGHFDLEEQTIISNNTRWKSFNLEKIKKTFPYSFVVNNNIECMALGEYLFNPEDTPEKFMFFHVGHGIYCSFFNSKHLGFKENDYIGEVGHTVVDIHGPQCECGKKGCLQTYISDSWLLKNARLLYKQSNKTTLKGLVDSPDDITIETIINAYKLGDIYLNNQIDLGLLLLGTSVANTLILQEADKIYLNSDLLSNTEFQEQITKRVEEQLQFIPISRDVKIEVKMPDRYRGAIGACALAAFAFFIKNENYL